jgi:hypothetical protein
MEIEIRGHVPVTGDCGHKFEIPITRIEDEFECPDCGHMDRFTDEQIASINAQIRDAAVRAGTEKVAEVWNDAIAKGLRGSKHIKQRKK